MKRFIVKIPGVLPNTVHDTLSLLTFKLFSCKLSQLPALSHETFCASPESPGPYIAEPLSSTHLHQLPDHRRTLSEQECLVSGPKRRHSRQHTYFLLPKMSLEVGSLPSPTGPWSPTHNTHQSPSFDPAKTVQTSHSRQQPSVSSRFRDLVKVSTRTSTLSVTSHPLLTKADLELVVLVIRLWRSLQCHRTTILSSTLFRSGSRPLLEPATRRVRCAGTGT